MLCNIMRIWKERNSLEKTWNMLFTPLGELFPPLPLNFLYLVLLPVRFIHFPFLQHSTAEKVLKCSECKSDLTSPKLLEFTPTSPALLTFGLGAAVSLLGAGEASTLEWVHSAPRRRWRSRNTAGTRLAGDLWGDKGLSGELLHKRDTWIYAD